MILRNSTVLIMVMLATLPASAHPGHAPLSQGTVHFMSSPYHLAAALLLGASSWALAEFLKTRSAKLVLRAAGATVAVGSLALWGMGA